MDLGSDGSLATDVSEAVQSIMERAERDAAAIARDAEADRARRLEAARADARAVREDAAREAAELAAARIERILALRRAITGDALSLARLSRDGAAAAARQLGELADALAERADLIAREAHVSTGEHHSPGADAPRDGHPEGNGAAQQDLPEAVVVNGATSEAADGAAGAAATDEPLDAHARPPRRRRFVRPWRSGAKARSGHAPSNEVIRWARLTALQMAVTGSSREEAEGRLLERFDIPDPGIVLDDVFGGRA